MSNTSSARRPNRLRYLLIAEAALLILTTSFASHRSSILSVIALGIASGQAALLGLWSAAGTGLRIQRSIHLMMGAAAILLVQFFRPDFSGWLILLIAMRIVVFSGVFGGLRHSRGLILSEQGNHVGLAAFQLRLVHLLIITFAVALFFALVRVQDRDGNDFVLVMLFALWGAGMAVAPLLAAMAAFTRRGEWATACVLTVLLVAIAAANAGFAFSQTSPRSAWTAAGRYFTWFLVESVVVAGSVIALRAIGYRLTVQRELETAADASRS